MEYEKPTGIDMREIESGGGNEIQPTGVVVVVLVIAAGYAAVAGAIAGAVGVMAAAAVSPVKVAAQT